VAISLGVDATRSELGNSEGMLETLTPQWTGARACVGNGSSSNDALTGGAGGVRPLIWPSSMLEKSGAARPI